MPTPLTEEESQAPLPPPATVKRLILSFAALLLFVPLLIFVIIQMEVPRLERDTNKELQTIAELKAQQIKTWLDERHSDGMSLSEDPGFVRQVAAALGSDSEGAQETLRQRLESFRDAYHYQSVRLLDPAGEVRLQLGPHHDVTAPHPLERDNGPNHDHHIDMMSGETLTGEHPPGHEFIHHLHGDQGVHMHFDFGLRRTPQEAPLATLQLDINPEQFLFPYITRWSTASASGETLLAEAVENRVLFITPLRHKPGQPGTINRPLSDSRLPAAVALYSGGNGTFRGRDYRGVEVFAAYHPVAGTRWQLIAKLDRDEVMAPLYHLIYWVGTVALAAVMLIGLLLTLNWRQQRQVTALRIEAERRKGDVLLQQFFDLPFIGIAITDPASKHWLRFNDELCAILGYPREELEQMSWAEVTHPDDLNIDVAEFEKVMRGESDGYTMDKRYIRKDGSVVDAYIDGKCIRNANGEVDYFVAMVQDISERKRAEQQLHDSEARFRATFDTVLDGILLVDTDSGRFSMGNAAIERMLGYSVEELQQLGIDDIHPPESLDHMHDQVQQQLRGEKSMAEALPVQRRDGSVFFADISAAPLQIKGRDYLVGVFRDITERKRTEEQLRSTYQLLNFALEQIPIPVIIARAPDITITHINAACKALLVDPPEDPYTITLENYPEHWPAYHPDGTPFGLEDYPLPRAILKGEPTHNEEIILRLPDGDRWVIASAAALRNDDGEIIAGIVAFPEITEQKLAQRALEQSRQRAQHYLDIAGVVMLSLDIEGRIVLANPRACELLGYDEQELLGRDWFEISLPEKEREKVREVFATLMRDQLAPVEFIENWITRRNGEERLIAWHNSVIHDENGVISGVLSSGEDITEIRRSETRLRTLINTIPDLVWLKDAEGVYLACNPMFERFFGASEAEIVGKTDYDFVDKELADSFREHDNEAMNAGHSSSNEERLTFAADGYQGTFESLKTPVRDEEGRVIGVLGIARDITERKEAAVRLEYLSRLYATLSQTNQAIVRSQGGQELFDAVCRNAVEYGGFRMATVMLIDPESREVHAVARYGEGTEYLDKLTLSVDPDTPFGRGPTGTALREGEPHWCQDFLHDEATQLWHERAEKFGYRASAALPIRRGGQVIGAFSVYAGTVDAFDEAVQELLIEMTADISFALDHLDHEQQRREAEERLALVIRGSNDAPWDWDLETDEFWYSPQWWTLSGYESDELPVDSTLWRTLMHPDDLPVVDEALGRILQPGQEWEQVECHTRHKDGHYIPVLVRAFATRDEADRAVRLSGTITDLTERKRLEEQLRGQRDELMHAKQVLDSHLDNSPIGVIEWDPQFRVLRWSDRAEEIFGWREEEVLNKRPDEFHFVYEAEAENVTQVFGKLLSGEQPRLHLINRNYTKEGALRLIEWFNSAIYDEQGQLLTVLSLVQDITEQHEAEKSLRQRENLLEQIFDILPVGLWFADSDGKLLRGNPAGEAIWGGEPHVGPAKYGVFKARRLPSGEPIEPDDWALAHTIREGVTVTDELLEIESFDGKKKTILNYTAPVTDDEGAIEGGIVVNLDITEREKARQQLQDQLDELNRWQDATLGREDRVLELKQEINQLLAHIGKPPRYPSAEARNNTNSQPEE
ncbi:MAG: PAS domain S-box protein [Gammaproteobacteria bacterium]|nr:PAS domain S-box protein [Gammaproteobacteria bacterium]